MSVPGPTALRRASERLRSDSDADVRWRFVYWSETAFFAPFRRLTVNRLANMIPYRRPILTPLAAKSRNRISSRVSVAATSTPRIDRVISDEGVF